MNESLKLQFFVQSVVNDLLHRMKYNRRRQPSFCFKTDCRVSTNLAMVHFVTKVLFQVVVFFSFNRHVFVSLNSIQYSVKNKHDSDEFKENGDNGRFD